ncbi:MAG: mannose-1-phosphate guanylyltransferase, partial [Verrucomicrobia bacterium]
MTQAFVLAAGLGTRLRPLTDELPKPLIPIFQKPLVTFALDH